MSVQWNMHNNCCLFLKINIHWKVMLSINKEAVILTFLWYKCQVALSDSNHCHELVEIFSSKILLMWWQWQSMRTIKLPVASYLKWDISIFNVYLLSSHVNNFLDYCFLRYAYCINVVTITVIIVTWHYYPSNDKHAERQTDR